MANSRVIRAGVFRSAVEAARIQARLPRYEEPSAGEVCDAVRAGVMGALLSVGGVISSRNVEPARVQTERGPVVHRALFGPVFR